MDAISLEDPGSYPLQPFSTTSTSGTSKTRVSGDFDTFNVGSAGELLLPPSEGILTPHRRSRELWMRFSGWRRGVFYCALKSLGVLLINIILLIWAMAGHGVEDGYGLLHTGSCKQAQTISTTLHVLINLLSTVLLGVSNYTMQCLNSPTRDDVDRAHAEKMWLDIGIASWRNRKYMSRKKLTLWWLLATSSVPLLFLYNSSVFLDVGAQEYQAIITGDTFQELVKRVVVRGITIGNDSEFTRLSAQDCMNVYDRPFVFGGGDVFIIADENSTSFAEATKVWSGVEESRLIQLGKSMQWKTQDLSINASYTDTDEYVEVQSCYAKLRPETCKVRFSRVLVLVIIICNACKALCMLRVAWGFADSPPLVTLGDAIASFLDNSDQTTNGLCLASKEDMQNGAWTEYQGPQRWIAKAETYSSVVSIKVWAIINVIFLLACATFLLISVVTAAASSGTVLGTGIGFSVSSKMAPSILPPVIANPGLWGTFLNILLVNTPQSLTSCLNLFYNNLFTNMLIGAKWNALAYERQPPRVTHPRGEQKSRLYLSMPYNYGIPVMFLSGMLHWLISESFFLVRITALQNGKTVEEHSISSMGYSALAFALAFTCSCTMILFLDMTARRRYGPGIPLVASCSAAISAACHLPEGDKGASLEAIQWGVIGGAGISVGSWRNSDEYFGHCGFSSKLVALPIPGRWYAGIIGESRKTKLD
ncbi:uncharacterized protein RCO7_09704 [Rhynchosporium graminicola]|uniref:DUF6536 domain-containing protein n=1 Tax=Rhynchosporium graminicola TaxID=2792576 RepID=A0A1E1L9B4_9HELO|nr:uncharacterized protein RCO7_09704 [Rhynchosporium commune]